MAKWTLERVRALDGYAVEWLEPGLTLLSRRHRLYSAPSPTGPRRLVGEAGAPAWKKLAAGLRLGQRLLRFMYYNVLPLPGGSLFVTFGKQVGVVEEGRYRHLGGLARPCRVLRGGCALAADGSVVWGEYIDNAERGPIHLYRYREGDREATVRQTFGAGEIRHVHGVYRDPTDDALWCLTGDRPEECRFLRSYDSFASLETYGAGDESWRAVSARFTADDIVYGSDAEYQTNRLYRVARATGERSVLAEVDGPVYYSHAIGDDLFLATTAELCPSQPEPVASIWRVAADRSVERLRSFEKDLIADRRVGALFMFGTLHFPSGPGLDGESYVSGVGLRGIENRTYRLAREPEPAAV